MSTDLNELNGKFETAMKHLNNRSANEKQKLQNTTESHIKSVESKHKEEIEDLTFRLEKLTAEMTEKST